MKPTSLPLSSSATRSSMDESYRYCIRTARRSARNFHYAFLSLPRGKYQAMCALYCFMRHTDDLADEPGIDQLIKRARLAEWAEQIQLIADGQSLRGEHPMFPALRHTIEQYRISPAYLQDVLTGVTMDLDPQPFDTFAQLERYCYHVAGAVGLSCIPIWGYDQSDEAQHAAIDCGTAFQLTNILRDIQEDSSLGRCYLPHDRLAFHGLTPHSLTTADSSQLLCFLQEHIDVTRAYYQRAARLSRHLSPDGQGIFCGMMRIYGGLFRKIERNPLSVLRGRVRLHRLTKMRIAMATYLHPRQPLPRWMRAS